MTPRAHYQRMRYWQECRDGAETRTGWKLFDSMRRWHRSQISFRDMVALTLEWHMPKILENVTHHNALFALLKRKM